MRFGDLSSEPVPRVAVVFEGCMAWLPEGRNVQRDFDRLMKRRHYDEAVDMFEFNERMSTVLWDRSWRMSMTIDVITYLGPDEWAVAVARRIGDEELPVHKVWATTPQLLGRKIQFMYDLVRVYDPFPEHQLMFGTQKGRYITRPDQLGY